MEPSRGGLPRISSMDSHDNLVDETADEDENI